MIAGLSTFWVVSIFMISDLDEAEETAIMATGDQSILKYYVSINIPLHVTFAVIYTVRLFLLLFIAYKRNKSGLRDPE